jgi:hypothetical protein
MEMIGFKIPDGFIDFADTRFNCPNCNKEFNDDDDKYCKRINKNKSLITKIKCDCKKTFCLTVNTHGDFVTFNGT